MLRQIFFKILAAFHKMKAQEKEEKDKIKFRYAVGLFKALKESNFKSFRKLAQEAGMEPAHIQKISVGKIDITLTTSVALKDALGMTYSQLSSFYDNVTEVDEQMFLQYLEEQKKIRGRAKKSKKSKSAKNKR